MFLERIITVCGKRDDGAVEGFESKLVHHDTGDVHGDVSPLDGRVNIPCFADDPNGSELGHAGDVLQVVAMTPEMRRRSLYTTIAVVLWEGY